MGSQHRGYRKQPNITETSLLNTKLSNHLSDRNTTTSKQLSTPGLKLLVEPREELVSALKLQVRTHSPATRTGTRYSGAKRVKLTPDSSGLCVELINGGVTLLKSMLLTNHRQIKSIPG